LEKEKGEITRIKRKNQRNKEEKGEKTTGREIWQKGKGKDDVIA